MLPYQKPSSDRSGLGYIDKPSSDRSGLGYIGESSSSANVSKEMKFVQAKEPVITTPFVESVKVEKKPNVTFYA